MYEKYNIPYKMNIIAKEIHTRRRSIKRIIVSEWPYRLAHIPDKGADTRHCHWKLSASDTDAIASLLDTSGFETRTNTWTDLAIKAAAIPAERFVTEDNIARQTQSDEDMSTYIAAVVRELSPKICTARIQWAEEMIQKNYRRLLETCHLDR
jgi:hypothetical protein